MRVSGHRQPVQQQAHPRPHHTEENWYLTSLSITADFMSPICHLFFLVNPYIFF